MMCLQKKEYNFDILKQGSERFSILVAANLLWAQRDKT